MQVERFSIDIDEAVLDDLRERLARTRWPGEAPGEAWEQGTDSAYLRELAASWLRFDWRTQEQELNRRPQFVADVDGVRIHFVHVRGGGIPLILPLGWPSAFIEFLPLIERLQHTFDLVIPSLPGYGFSERPPRLSTRDTAAIWHLLMRGLGYERYGAHGGDFGAAVTTYMALDAPESLLGIHLSNLDNAPTVTTPLSEAERAFVAATERWDARERGYSLIQGTKPQTLALLGHRDDRDLDPRLRRQPRRGHRDARTRRLGRRPQQLRQRGRPPARVGGADVRRAQLQEHAPRRALRGGRGAGPARGRHRRVLQSAAVRIAQARSMSASRSAISRSASRRSAARFSGLASSRSSLASIRRVCSRR